MDAVSGIHAMDDLSYLTSLIDGMRGARWDHVRRDWDEHIEQLTHEGKFETEYRMSLQANNELVRILDPLLERKEYNSRCTEPIQVEHIVGLGLRVLSGGAVSDNRHVFGMSKPAAYPCLNDFIYAVNTSPELEIKFPSTVQEWNQRNYEFRSKSTHEIMSGACLAVDGFFQRTNKPTKKEVSNQLAYYSGHYESYGLNSQEACFADLSFGYFGTVAPGQANDHVAYPTARSLKNTVENLPPNLYAVADAAYTVSENMLIPFTGNDRFDIDQDAFNFYLSQVRIRIEMAFGRLVNKFRILNGTVEGPMERVADILQACARLHNFIIRQDCPSFPTFADMSLEEEMRDLDLSPHPRAPLGHMAYLPTMPVDCSEIIYGVSHSACVFGAQMVPRFAAEQMMRCCGSSSSDSVGKILCWRCSEVAGAGSWQMRIEKRM
ncbi:hypothetical protein ACHAXR_003002 [Thalassiosira sp. AJA248-18]